MKKYDIAVIDGGFAGVSAALAAAREGAQVILIEKANCLGGAATIGLVSPFMPYWTKIDGTQTNLADGLFTTIRQKLGCASITDICEQGLHTVVHSSFSEEYLKLVLNDMLLEAGVKLLFHACIFKSVTQEGRVRSVSLATRSGEMSVEADYFIDATGDAQLAFLSGCPTVLGREPDHLCQPMTLSFRLGNVDVKKFFASHPKWSAAYSQAQATGQLLNPREDIFALKTIVPNVLHFNTTRVVKLNPTDPEDLSEAEILARKQVFEVFDFLKANADGLEDSFLMMTAPEIGVRESRMILGDHILTEHDCKACTKFDDAIAACNYDIDIHNPEGSGTSHYYFPEGQYYTIPYRSLIPKTVDNMLVAGRCISSDHNAQASYRIMPTVCCIGEAAGTAAGIAVRDRIPVREVDIRLLQKTLKANGAFIGI